MSAAAALLLLSTATACPDSPAQARLRTLTLNAAGAGTGSVLATPLRSGYSDGTTVSLAATPASGSAFTGWSGDCAGTTNPCSIIMSADRTVTATFASATSVGRFDGVYTGTWSGGQSDGMTLNGTLAMTVANGVVTGAIVPISGSTNAYAGVMSDSGTITATIAAGNRGCNVALAGQVTTASGGATVTGTYSLLASQTCNTASGTWTAARR